MFDETEVKGSYSVMAWSAPEKAKYLSDVRLFYLLLGELLTLTFETLCSLGMFSSCC